MILEMKVPSPGESITEVEIATWLVADGDYVEKDQIIAELDSDKATLELPAEEGGVITLKANEGDSVDVGQVVCLIDTSKEGKSTKIVEEKTDEVAPSSDNTDINCLLFGPKIPRQAISSVTSLNSTSFDKYFKI